LCDDESMTLGFKNDKVCQLPVSSLANEANDSAAPLCLARPAAATTELLAFERLARIVSKELLQLPHRSSSETHGFVTFDGNIEKFEVSSIELTSSEGLLVVRAFSESGALQIRIAPDELKTRDPKSGEKLKDSVSDESTEDDGGDGITIYRAKKRVDKAVPERIEKKASVGYEVVWNDGAKYIYSRRALAVAAGGKVSAS
jgi:hypothetical protein